MKGIKSILVVVAAALTGILLAQCSPSPKDTVASKGPKCLILYYSQTGTTQAVAQTIGDLIGEEPVSFDVKEPYNGTYEETINRCLSEMEDDAVPGLKPLSVNVDDYDVIFLGFPVWFGTYARPVMALLEETDFEGKTIIPFCTFGSGGLESSVSELRNACPDANVTDGYGVRAVRMDKMPAEVKQFLIDNGYIDGEKQQLPEYSSQHPVGPDEREIFQQACGDYPMPIGEPVSVGMRENGHGTDYLFTVSTTNRDGEQVEALVYVTCEEAEEPVFTKVVR